MALFCFGKKAQAKNLKYTHWNSWLAHIYNEIYQNCRGLSYTYHYIIKFVFPSFMFLYFTFRVVRGGMQLRFIQLNAMSIEQAHRCAINAMSIEQAHRCATNAIGTGPQVSKITQNVMCYTLFNCGREWSSANYIGNSN